MCPLFPQARTTFEIRPFIWATVTDVCAVEVFVHFPSLGVPIWVRPRPGMTHPLITQRESPRHMLYSSGRLCGSAKRMLHLLTRFSMARLCWLGGIWAARPGVVQTYGRREGRNVMLLGSGGRPVPCLVRGVWRPRSQAAAATGTGGRERECCWQVLASTPPPGPSCV